MISRRSALALSLAALVGAAALAPDGLAGGKKEQPKKFKDVWTDPNDPTLPPEFAFQGEYLGTINGAKAGCQVIALGGGAFQAVILPGGLPGDGWDGKNKILMAGKLEGDRAVFTPASGKRKYLGRSPEEFSATAKFPPPGHKDYTATITGASADRGTLEGKTDEGKPFTLTKTVRRSPTLGLKPPSGAVVLFDGTHTDEWTRGRLDKAAGTINTDGGDILTKRKFNNYTMHVEFLLPFRPYGRGQERGNSGFYQVHLYEVQILDSFGLEGKNNECGGLYSKKDPKVNMCLPPLVWQTYDAEFTNAVRDETGKRVKNARLTLKHNGVVVHDDVEIPGPSGGGREGQKNAEGTPGPIMFQGHGNPLAFRNVWIVEKQ